MGIWPGPAFPFGRDTSGALSPQIDAHVIHTNIINILTTRKGSLEVDPSAGSMVPFLVFELNDYTTMQLIRYYAMTEVTEQEPRIDVLGADVLADIDGYTITVVVIWVMKGDATQKVYGTKFEFDNRELAESAA